MSLFSTPLSAALAGTGLACFCIDAPPNTSRAKYCPDCRPIVHRRGEQMRQAERNERRRTMTDYDTLVKEYAQLTDQKASIDERLDTIKHELRALGVGSYEFAGLAVTISPNRRIDNRRVQTLYPFSSHPELYKLTPDPKLIRENLPPKVVTSLMAEIGEPKVTVK